MADVELTPRDEVYVPAVVSQSALFPGLGMTVHDLVVSGDRLAMRFSQHGASTGHYGRLASWSGIGLYRWNGQRLTDNFAIEDYEGRRVQLGGGSTAAIDAPMVAPWDVVELPPDRAAEELVGEMVESGSMLVHPGVAFDDGKVPGTHLVEPAAIVVDDLFSAGRSVGFKLTVRGPYRDGLAVAAELAGTTVELHAVGLVRVDDDGDVTGHIVRGRGPARRALLAASRGPTSASAVRRPTGRSRMSCAQGSAGSPLR